MHSDYIPKFVRGRTAIRLQRNMVKLQEQLQARVEFTDKQYCPQDNYWYAWYVIREYENAE